MLSVLTLTFVLVIVCIIIHYESLTAITAMRQRYENIHRRWIIVLIHWAIVTHIVEISVFACGYAILNQFDSAGMLLHSAGSRSDDYLYFSAVAYTSLGFGDITPDGPLRFTVVVETLTGLLLIAWTASLVFVEMQSSWNRDKKEPRTD
jgi:hypothetical protein